LSLWVADRPNDESLHRVFMEALDQAGRRWDALDVYEHLNCSPSPAPPLELPDLRLPADPARLARLDSVPLFLERPAVHGT
jgi:DNA-binding SARP family transcriptional activator